MKTKDQQLVNEILNDFKNRQNERKQFDSTWRLCMNFLMGNQYCGIAYNNEVEDTDKQYFWQEREVYNHIAPTINYRMAKLQRLRPTMNVIPASNEEADVKTAKLSKKIINSLYNKNEITSLIADATKWSEVTGTCFYKASWNKDFGDAISIGEEQVRLGDVEISTCSPFEIFPDSCCNERVEDCQSIIHAKAYHVDQIERIWGVKLDGESVDVFSLDNNSQNVGGLGYIGNTTKITNTTKQNHAVVIEKYTKPSVEFPNGRLSVVAGDKLVYDGDLPYLNGENGLREFPFIKQVCDFQAGCFWGVGIVERLIPIQRAYNAVKNRKHEFLNRVSMGVVTVEDGSVDLDNLEEEGLSPGKILVYRQGSNAPSFMDSSSVPTDFDKEEKALLEEFTQVSGVSDLSKNLTSYSSLSGVALELLLEQDDSRINTTSERIKEAIKQVAKHILRLYKQFAIIPRICKYVENGSDLEMLYFSASDISSDDVVFETDTQLNTTLAQRKNMVFNMLEAGLLFDENGKLSNRMRVKALDLLGFGIWENAQDLNELHMKKAGNENIDLKNGKLIKVSEIDDNDIHLSEHISFMLGNDYAKAFNDNPKIENVFLTHIREHKRNLVKTDKVEE